jgi:hypothetical protein
MAHRLVWCWWRFITWRILCNADGASSDGTPSFLVVDTLHQIAQLSLVLVVLHRMTQSLVWLWWRFIIWHTVSSHAYGASSDGATFLVLAALHWMA